MRQESPAEARVTRDSSASNNS